MVDATRLAGKTALVTGGSSGIGRRTAERLLAEGATVVIADRRPSDDVAARSAGQARFIACDVAREEDCAAAVQFAVDEFGRLDILVNNAGVTGNPGRVHEYSTQDWDRVLDVNARGAFLMMRAALGPMLDAGSGSIVNVASVGAFVHAGGSTAYAPSKGALLMLTRQSAIDYARDGVRVNAVCPGLTETPILDGAPGGPDSLASLVPIGRLGRPEEIAALIAYLASDEAAFVTGSAFVIDGGMTAV